MRIKYISKDKVFCEYGTKTDVSSQKIKPQDIRYLYEQKIYNNRETVLFKPHQPYVLQLQ